MTQRTLTVTYDDQNIHDTLTVATDDPGHARLNEGVIFIASPSPTPGADDARHMAIGIYNVGDLSGNRVYDYAHNVVGRIVERLSGL
jgi:hypothetical protein